MRDDELRDCAFGGARRVADGSLRPEDERADDRKSGESRRLIAEKTSSEERVSYL